MAKTITRRDRTVEETDQEEYDRYMSAHDRVDLEPDTNYAACLITLHPDVVEEDYPALKALIEEIPGITKIELLIDHHTDVDVPVDRKLVGVCDFKIRRDKS